MKKGDVIVVAQVHPVLIEGLQTLGYSPIVAEKMSLSEIKELLPNCTGIITANRLPLDRTLLQTATNLQWIGRMGSGMEIIDTEYAKERGIGCYSSPEGNCNAVAEHALGMLIGLTKKISSSFTEVKAGKWAARRKPRHRAGRQDCRHYWLWTHGRGLCEKAERF